MPPLRFPPQCIAIIRVLHLQAKNIGALDKSFFSHKKGPSQRQTFSIKIDFTSYFSSEPSSSVDSASPGLALDDKNSNP